MAPRAKTMSIRWLVNCLSHGSNNPQYVWVDLAGIIHNNPLFLRQSAGFLTAQLAIQHHDMSRAEWGACERQYAETAPPHPRRRFSAHAPTWEWNGNLSGSKNWVQFVPFKRSKWWLSDLGVPHFQRNSDAHGQKKVEKTSVGLWLSLHSAAWNCDLSLLSSER